MFDHTKQPRTELKWRSCHTCTKTRPKLRSLDWTSGECSFIVPISKEHGIPCSWRMVTHNVHMRKLNTIDAWPHNQKLQKQFRNANNGNCSATFYVCGSFGSHKRETPTSLLRRVANTVCMKPGQIGLSKLLSHCWPELCKNKSDTVSLIERARCNVDTRPNALFAVGIIANN